MTDSALRNVGRNPMEKEKKGGEGMQGKATILESQHFKVQQNC